MTTNALKETVESPTAALAEFAAGITYGSLPSDVVDMVKRCLLDSLGCALYGSATPWANSMSRVVDSLGQSPAASVWGMRVKADPLGAALVNGTATQGYELDDCHDQSMSHYGASVVPAVLGVAQAHGGYSGEQLILAIAVGYEVGTRIGNTVSPGAFHRGFHPCGLTGTFAAAAAVASLLKLDKTRFIHTLGLAGSQAAGLMAAQYGAMAKRFHSGKAAQNGIIAALSAREGLTGVRDVLEAPYGGFCSTYTADYDLSYATSGLGEHYEILRNGFKRYSSLASSHTSVDAMRAIRADHGVTAEEVEKVVIETTAMVHRHCGLPYAPNGETITAQMNLPFTAAVTLMDGIAFVDQYVDQRLDDPATLDLARRIEVVVAPDLDALGPDEMRIVRATVTTRNGQTLTTTVPYRSGHWKNPLAPEEMDEKFRDLSGRILTDDAVDAIGRVVGDLEAEEAPAEILGTYLQDLR